jgi:plasmid stability protein
MAKMIQIRHVPDTLHRQLRAHAARAGMSLSDYIKSELEQSVKRMTLEEVFEELSALEPVKPSETSIEIIRRMRGK